MALFNRDKIWYTAWGLVPVAVVLNLLLFAPRERATRLVQQAQIDASARHWTDARERYESAARIDPSSALAAHNAGVANAKLGDWGQTAYWTVVALERSSTFAPAVKGRKELARDHPRLLAEAEAQRARERESGLAP